MGKNSFYITTPIYYVNDKPHIGHSYTTILADVIARYHRLIGDPTFFLTGTDEHGQKVDLAAKKADITPQQQADSTVVRFQELWEKLGITHDDFIRTTQTRHTDVVQKILQDLYDRDEIYKAEYDGWYDVSSETFVTEKDVDTENPGPNIVRIKESNYFFRMGKRRQWLIDYINEHPAFIQPDFRRNETLGFLKQELNDLCISRPKSRLGWGIELPFDTDFVTYVWFDALVNYISGVGYLSDDEKFETWWPTSCHLIGKDILTTHTVYWPTMLDAMGVPQPKTVFAHGWWLARKADADEEGKMGKSEGNAVDPMKLIEKYDVDSFRYFLIAEMTLGHDATYAEEKFITRYNAELANDLGNLLNRVLTLTSKNCEAKIPAVPENAHQGDDEATLWTEIQAAVER
ncbi:MAG: class I tRNA ligase family protein, partial [Verrucomicrobiota bacterium]